jgi:hypothetical protein
MAIGSLDRAGRLEQLRTFAAVQLRAGYRSDDEARADVLEALLAEVRDPEEAARLTGLYLSEAMSSWRREAAGWPETTDHDRLRAALAALEDGGLVVLEAVDDHWVANDTLVELQERGERPRGVAYFTLTDVWHAVEHGMLEVNLWHADRANVLDTDALLAETLAVFAEHGLEARFDEGRIEVAVAWQRRPPSDS